MLNSQQCGITFYHYYLLANEVPCPDMDNLTEHDFGHGKFVRFSDGSENYFIGVTIRGRTVVIQFTDSNGQLKILRPTQSNSTFRLFNLREGGDSFYNGDYLSSQDVTSVMEQIAMYI